MLWTASGIKGYAIHASDGNIGTVSDILFNDDDWLVRWLVIDTGNWLSGVKVLVPPFVLGEPDPAKRECPVRLTTAQVKDSPGIDTDRSVSRQMESDVYDYYGWRPYWASGFYTGGYVYAGDGWTGLPPSGALRREDEIAANRRNNDDPHLRSIEGTTGYHVHAIDGEIGHVEDFLIQNADWSIHYLVVDTKNWWPGKKVLISPSSAHDINWSGRLVNLDVDRQRVKTSPEYDATTTVDRGYEMRFHNHYDDIRARDQL
jgi:hypothetical protein